MMIWFVAQDSKRAIKLLNKDEPHEFMREGHLAERYLFVGSVIHFLRKAIRATHNKHKSFAAARHATL